MWIIPKCYIKDRIVPQTMQFVSFANLNEKLAKIFVLNLYRLTKNHNLFNSVETISAIY